MSELLTSSISLKFYVELVGACDRMENDLTGHLHVHTK
jgi:hypothetical protein